MVDHVPLPKKGGPDEEKTCAKILLAMLEELGWKPPAHHHKRLIFSIGPVRENL